MLDLLLTLVTGQIGANLKRFARLAAFGALTLTFAIIALAAGAQALFLALDAALGPIRAALIVAAGAVVLAGLASIPAVAQARSAATFGGGDAGADRHRRRPRVHGGAQGEEGFRLSGEP